MKKVFNSIVFLVAAGILLGCSPLMATNGFAPIGFGQKSKGMGGAGVAFSQDSIAGSTNPAGMFDLGNRYDIGFELFKPTRETEIVGNSNTSINHTYDASSRKNFFVPELGFNLKMNPKTTLGVSLFGNGGMNTSYKTAIPLFDATGANNAGVDLSQMFIVPTIAHKLDEKNIIGLGLNLVYQKVQVHGVGNFMGMSQSPTNVTENGYDSSTGVGFRLGWLGHMSSKFSMGFTYQARTHMSKFDKYQGLFADNGSFDIPSNYALGLKFQTCPKTVIAADIMKINYSESSSVGNTRNPAMSNGVALGASNGSGFGWNDQTIFKIGIAHQYNDRLTLRAGYNHGNNPVPSEETLFNMLAPGITEDHATLGATWQMNDGSEWTISYMHAFVNTVNGTNSIPVGAPPAGFGGGEANLTMYQDSIGIAYGRPF